jgi:hypothetical protein
MKPFICCECENKDCHDCGECCDCGGCDCENKDCHDCGECNNCNPPSTPSSLRPSGTSGTPTTPVTTDAPTTSANPDTTTTSADPDTQATPDSSDGTAGNQDNQTSESPVIIITDEGDALFMFPGKFEDLEIVFLNDVPFRAVVVDNGDFWELYLYGDTDYGLGEGYAYHFSVGKVFAGSTVVLIYDEFIQTLRNGTYTITVMFIDGTFGVMEFEVEGNEEPEIRDTNPKTGVTSGFTAAVIAGSVAAVMHKRKKCMKRAERPTR